MLTTDIVWKRILLLPDPRQTEAIRLFIGHYGKDAIPIKRMSADQVAYESCREDIELFGKTFLPYLDPGDSMIQILHILCYRLEKPFTVKRRARQAKITLRHIRDELKDNKDIVRVYGSKVGDYI